jgi:hypothetical protein
MSIAPPGYPTDETDPGSGNRQADDPVQHEFRSVQVLRGRVNNAKAKWQSEGWEFVSEQRGTLRTELNFRRAKPKTLGRHLLSTVATFRRLHPRTQSAVVASCALILVAGITGIIVGTQSGGDTEKTASGRAETTGTSAPTETVDAKTAAMETADAALLHGDYDKAVAAIAGLQDDSLTERYKSTAAGKLRTEARRALESSAKDARELALKAQAYDPTTQGRALVSAAESKLTAQRRAAERKREEKRAAATRKEAQTQSEAEQYAGRTCTEIGHSFEVVPGSDPDHDANNDGVACESQ